MTSETTPIQTRYECPECDWTGTIDDLNGLHHIHHIQERLSEGELVPAGVCPECSALVSVEDADIPDDTLHSIAHTMRARGWVVIEPVQVAPAMPANPIANAIASLDVARNSGGELDIAAYEESHTLLVKMRNAILKHNQEVNAAERSPTGDDYNAILVILGLIAVKS